MSFSPYRSQMTDPVIMLFKINVSIHLANHATVQFSLFLFEDWCEVFQRLLRRGREREFRFWWKKDV